ncbi:MAG: hypothetical protein J7J72_00720 [Bacteroidales bacterium]|nr:hypothetical protein [Bacteroidales bacterium]
MNTQPESGYFCFFTTLKLTNFNPNGNNDWMILESSSAPGYYSKANFPLNERRQYDHHLYVVVKKTAPCFQDMVLRKSGEIIREQKLTIYASPGQITLFNKYYQCIRVRVSQIDDIYPLIDALKAEGVEFLKYKKVKPYASFIQHKKYIKLRKLEECVYQDEQVPNRYFIQIPRPINYNEFEKMIEDIKHNCKFNHFDASLAYLNQGDHTFDFAALYSDHCENHRLSEFKHQIDKLII